MCSECRSIEGTEDVLWEVGQRITLAVVDSIQQMSC